MTTRTAPSTPAPPAGDRTAAPARASGVRDRDRNRWEDRRRPDPPDPPSPVVRALGRWSIQAEPGGPRVDVVGGILRQTLAALVAHGPGGAGADILADTIWPGALPKRWPPALRMSLSRLRPVLPAGAIPFRPYRLDLPSCSVDVWHLVDLAGRADHTPSDADLDWMLAGAPYPDIELSPPLALAAAVAHRAQRRVALRFAASSPAVVTDRTCDRLEWFVSADPLDETVAVEVAGLLGRANRTGDALHLLRRFASAYRSETGAVPFRAAALLTDLAAGRAPR